MIPGGPLEPHLIVYADQVTLNGLSVHRQGGEMLEIEFNVVGNQLINQSCLHNETPLKSLVVFLVDNIPCHMSMPDRSCVLRTMEALHLEPSTLPHVSLPWLILVYPFPVINITTRITGSPEFCESF